MLNHLAASAVMLLCGLAAGTSFASSSIAAPLSVNYLDVAALVFQPPSVAKNTLPASILLPGVPLTSAAEIGQACRSVHTRSDDLLVFLPSSKTCMSLGDLFKLARETHPQQALFVVLERDRKLLLKGLETLALQVIRPKSTSLALRIPDGPAAAEVCSCPNPDGIIFVDGFETLL